MRSEAIRAIGKGFVKEMPEIVKLRCTSSRAAAEPREQLEENRTLIRLTDKMLVTPQAGNEDSNSQVHEDPMVVNTECSKLMAQMRTLRLPGSTSDQAVAFTSSLQSVDTQQRLNLSVDGYILCPPAASFVSCRSSAAIIQIDRLPAALTLKRG